ncbi:uncharacterized protein LOC129575704 [Sitodiplosis mosellana]|uniref:uncharacterized protein LOC129575704 n=1 Tax=Sitodiplosis mosellana TaxID=263140 RepID=UPI002443A562|nr:uncharacterized protein LOC129575704 [Sitodiplosis mosellana]
MASNLSVVFLLLFVYQVCFSASIPTEISTTTVKTVEQSEEFIKMKLQLEKNLNEVEKIELNGAIFNLTMADTLEQGIEGALKLIQIGVMAALREEETSPPTPAPSAASP